ncbi:uncharacterized protein LOC131841392 [Achroia grisella]|uniref:uncharacterized protein LOC131841392 n=1 Tax=Achroia grisella TaxID=688607 RepID=UPI0027D24F64|nr:uncharacterized protein LOC131841392 [Achroia grisella]
MVKIINTENLFQDIIDEDFIKIFQPINTVQSFLGFNRVDIKLRFVTSKTKFWKFYSILLLLINLLCFYDIVLNYEFNFTAFSSSIFFKLGITFHQILTIVIMWRNNFLNNNINSQLYVKLQNVDRVLNMHNQNSLNRKFSLLSFISLCLILIFEFLLSFLIMLIIDSRVVYINKLLENVTKMKQKSDKKEPRIKEKVTQMSDDLKIIDEEMRNVLVFGVHNILDALTDFIKLFQFEMGSDVKLITRFVLPYVLLLVVMLICMSFMGEFLSSSLKTCRELSISLLSCNDDKSRRTAKQILSLLVEKKCIVSIYNIFTLNTQLPLNLLVITANYTIVLLQFATL